MSNLHRHSLKALPGRFYELTQREPATTLRGFTAGEIVYCDPSTHNSTTGSAMMMVQKVDLASPVTAWVKGFAYMSSLTPTTRNPLLELIECVPPNPRDQWVKRHMDAVFCTSECLVTSRNTCCHFCSVTTCADTCGNDPLQCGDSQMDDDYSYRQYYAEENDMFICRDCDDMLTFDDYYADDDLCVDCHADREE